MGFRVSVARRRVVRAGGRVEILYFTFTAIILYLGSDWILRRVEVAIGRPLEHRNLIFFAILLVMAVASFALIRQYAGQ